MRQRGMAKTVTVLEPRKQIAKKMTQPWGKQKWCLQSGTEIAWVRIERGHSLNRGPSPSKLYSNLIQSLPFSGTLRPVHHLSVLHRKKNTHISVESRLWDCLYLFGFASVESGWTNFSAGWQGAEAVQLPEGGGGGGGRGGGMARV